MHQRSTHCARLCFWLIALSLVGLVTSAAKATPLIPRERYIKPAEPEPLREYHRQDAILVKFQDGLPLAITNNRLDDNGTTALDNIQPALDLMIGGSWQRHAATQPARLDTLRDAAVFRLGRELADPTVEFILTLPNGLDPVQAIGIFNEYDAVEYALPLHRPTPPPALPPDFQPNQGYLNASPSGVDANAVWDTFGIRGQGVKVLDIEYQFNANHADLPPIEVVGPPYGDPFGNNNHGTAVFGQMASLDNGWGTTGIAPDASYAFAGASPNGFWNVASAIYSAIDALEPGDIILIEQQVWGPNSNFDPSCFGCLPVEWQPAIYNAIQIAVGNGITVVQAGANGSQNLDDPIYSTGNGGHHPFLPENDSGAIIVGAGAAPASFGGSDVDRSRLGFSNYGSRVDVQGWGERVYTTGYGWVYSSQGINFYYTQAFGGTSSASPIIAGAAALIQSAYETQFNNPLSPQAMRNLLKSFGAPQRNGTYPITQNIGPRPDAFAAIESFWNATPACPADLNQSQTVDSDDLGLLLAAFGIDSTGDVDGDADTDSDDLGLLLAAFGQPCQ